MTYITGESSKIKALCGPFFLIPCHFLQDLSISTLELLENLVFLNVSRSRLQKKVGTFSSALFFLASGSTLCLLLMTDGANSVQPNDMAEAVAAHQVPSAGNFRNQLPERIYLHPWIFCIPLVLQIPCPIRRCLGTQNPLQNHLQKGLEHKGSYLWGCQNLGSNRPDINKHRCLEHGPFQEVLVAEKGRFSSQPCLVYWRDLVLKHCVDMTGQIPTRTMNFCQRLHPKIIPARDPKQCFKN